MMELTNEEIERLIEEEIELLTSIAEDIGVARSYWAAEPPEGYNFNLRFTDKTVYFKNKQGGELYKLVAPTYADIWKAFEKSLIDIGPTDHIFIEDVEVLSKTLKIQTGS